ncbi:uncharacterized protein SOCE26_042620 [Sorangium cellulosum]|uniref:Uncharacterized protein n=1 Tax=Sorangium cellulosum TaxID=56 RepID=A0A2L0EU46_SORCE|nr:uncharacterized protein SOCE26_042620 [Sorangium cellulosum]
MLDGTYNPLVAAFFALSDRSPDDAAIFRLNLSDYPFPATLGRRLPECAFQIENLRAHLGGRTPPFFTPVSSLLPRDDAAATPPAAESALVMLRGRDHEREPDRGEEAPPAAASAGAGASRSPAREIPRWVSFIAAARARAARIGFVFVNSRGRPLSSNSHVASRFRENRWMSG